MTWRSFLKSGRRPTILRSSLNMAADLKTQWSSSKNQRAADLPNEQMLGEDGEPRTSRQERCEDPADQRPHVHLPTPKSSTFPPSPPPPRPSSTQSDAIEKLLSRRFHAQASTPEECTPLRKTGLQKQSLLLNSSSSLSSPPHPATKKIAASHAKRSRSKNAQSERPLPAASIGKEPKFYMPKLAYRFNFSILASYIN